MNKNFPITYPQQKSMEQDNLNRKDIVHVEVVDYTSLNEKEWITDTIIRFHQVYLMQTMQLHRIYMINFIQAESNSQFCKHATRVIGACPFLFFYFKKHTFNHWAIVHNRKTIYCLIRNKSLSVYDKVFMIHPLVKTIVSYSLFGDLFVYRCCLLRVFSFVWYSDTEVSLLALVYLLSLFCFYSSSSAYLVFVHDITAQYLSRVVCLVDDKQLSFWCLCSFFSLSWKEVLYCFLRIPISFSLFVPKVNCSMWGIVMPKNGPYRS
ncbi:hypothetical protein BDA99DRAFT_534830 [Phascolomyces articulosus]|uniref:Uncharacterized protein n=1 Tax=Phascolomyces articulosus TaxID=60185 RepID=A0AAD5PH23_9FUNG|nr:hypothetical protein BDA99DRAFT_534830 [Phascolomyces articulosus]